MRENGIKKDNKGFSLVEIIIVIAVMAILTGFIAPQVMTYVEESREAKDLQMVNSVFTAVQTAVALKSDTSITNATIEDTITALPKLGNLLGTGMDETGEIRAKAKSKKGSTGTLYVNYVASSGELKVYIGSAPGTETIPAVKNY